MNFIVRSLKLEKGNMFYSCEKICSFIVDLRQQIIKTDVDFIQNLSDFLILEIVCVETNNVVFDLGILCDLNEDFKKYINSGLDPIEYIKEYINLIEEEEEEEEEEIKKKKWRLRKNGN